MSAKRQRKPKSKLREFVEAVALALILAFVIMAWGVQAFKIPSSSMEPTLLIGDHLLVTKSGYDLKIPFSSFKIPFTEWRLPLEDKVLFRFSDPQRGDIIVFRYPEDRSKDFIKRIVGLPGETIEVRNKRVLINGKLIKDPWGHYSDRVIWHRGATPRDHFGPVKVPPDKYFVMGDNRDHSHDSRFWFGGSGGFVPRKDILGRARLIYWSWRGESFAVRWSRLLTLIH